MCVSMSHRADEGGAHGSVPSTEFLIDELIFTQRDVVNVTARSIDVDFATKGKFSMCFTNM